MINWIRSHPRTLRYLGWAAIILTIILFQDEVRNVVRPSTDVTCEDVEGAVCSKEQSNATPKGVRPGGGGSPPSGQPGPGEPGPTPSPPSPGPSPNPPSPGPTNGPIKEITDGVGDAVEGVGNAVDQTTCNLAPALCR